MAVYLGEVLLAEVKNIIYIYYYIYNIYIIYIVKVILVHFSAHEKTAICHLYHFEKKIELLIKIFT